MNAMKKLLVLAVLAAGLGAAVAAVPPAFAGGCCGGGGGGCCAKSDDGFECMNQCPLAQEANKHRASGRESFAVSTALRATYAATVQKNLARI
jgi:hypothetical protein